MQFEFGAGNLKNKLKFFTAGVVFVELGTAIQQPGADYAYTMYIDWRAFSFVFMVVSVR